MSQTLCISNQDSTFLKCTFCANFNTFKILIYNYQNNTKKHQDNTFCKVWLEVIFFNPCPDLCTPNQDSHFKVFRTPLLKNSLFNTHFLPFLKCCKPFVHLIRTALLKNALFVLILTLSKYSFTTIKMSKTTACCTKVGWKALFSYRFYQNRVLGYPPGSDKRPRAGPIPFRD